MEIIEGAKKTHGFIVVQRKMGESVFIGENYKITAIRLDMGFAFLDVTNLKDKKVTPVSMAKGERHEGFEDFNIVLTHIRDRQVSIGIEAPYETKILREELLLREMLND